MEKCGEKLSKWISRGNGSVDKPLLARDDVFEIYFEHKYCYERFIVQAFILMAT
jgi:hypothetical protein